MKRQNVDRARGLRQSMTDAERKLWHRLRNRQLCGCKFRRQHEIDHYIVDFACMEAMLIIELDGGQHAEQVSYDEHRTRHLQAKGYRVLRFWNNEALTNIESVLEVILEAVAKPPPHPSPLPAGERGQFAPESEE
ncbi:DNA methylase [Rhodanobacter sp. FW510-R12]|uniref:endonuclease domain-containing protein n=1 Tax=unclassified Rhodanobacter TaxID=2621553 RepID=UPI0007A9C3F6|nr:MULTISPECIES: endonuclease domain-containing protein [unclassified Rhodanobacter]KZC15795.1 DNA methylase [Rhodanobacter sp. FW104-R8]KZC26103.1 DNA methylase [Rhodanobacter sp. FW510-T8]KZC30357.1 DNA methylase [Rhodanobacter sp. FW510-R10]